MEQVLIVRGRYAGRTFIPDGPLPDEEGMAELIITPTPPRARGSVADACSHHFRDKSWIGITT